jgi:hypothetical protein
MGDFLLNSLQSQKLANHAFPKTAAHSLQHNVTKFLLEQGADPQVYDWRENWCEAPFLFLLPQFTLFNTNFVYLVPQYPPSAKAANYPSPAKSLS